MQDSLYNLECQIAHEDDYDKDIVDVILKTNDHVDISGEGPNGPVEETSDESPTIRVKYEEPIVIPDPDEPTIEPEPDEPDNTVSPDPIPQTGDILF